VADIVVGFACLEAEAGGELVFGEAAEFPECDHADLFLDGLFLGEGDGLPCTVGEHERAVFGLNAELESHLHGRSLLRGGIDKSRVRPICIYNLCQSQERSTVENRETSSAGLMDINVSIIDS